MVELPVKRCKYTNRGEDDYLPGNIFEIELRNFMTFDKIKCQPGSRLNLVTGPNGSGKSSLVCAIALGLGGEPALLGRASSVGAFVKRGEESGFVKISLRGETPGTQFVITRKIDTCNKSEWMCNGKGVTKKYIDDITRKFNIQVNNLTQFLPQDRVCEFAKLTPERLLEETQKAVGDPLLPVHHEELIKFSHKLKTLEVTVKRNGETLNQLKALNAEQEKDVQRVRQREELLGEVELMKKKLPWLRYDFKKTEYLKAKKDEDDAKTDLDEAAKVLNDLKVPIEKQKKVKVKEELALKKVSNIISDNANNRMKIVEHESRLGVQVRAKYDEMEELRRQEESRQQRISTAKEDLAAAELELANLPVYERPKDEIDRLYNQILEIEYSANQKGSQKSERGNLINQKKRTLWQCTEKLKDLENANNKLLQALQRSGADKIFDAYRWLQEHRNELNKEVYGPVLLEVNVPNREHAGYLENHVPYYVWKSFITQDAADRDFLFRSLKSFDVPVLNFTGDKGDTKLPFEVSEEMHRLGIYSRLDQVFDAPNAVKDVLTTQFGLENSYIGSKEADRKADGAPQLGIHDLWTPENHYRWSISRYGGHVSASVQPVNPSRLFLCSLDVGEIEKLRFRKKELEDNISSLEENFKILQTEQRHLEDEAAKLRKQRDDIINTVQRETNKRRDLEKRVNQRRMKLESIEKEDDLDTNINRLTDQAARLNMQRFQKAIEIKNLLIEAVILKWSFAEKQMMHIEHDVKIRQLEVNIKNQEKAALQASMHYENCKKEKEMFREALLALKQYAESVAIITPDLAQKFLEMPSTVEELEAAIQDTISQANSILFLNHNILEEYENRRRKIEEMSTVVTADEKELQRCLAAIDDLKEKWLPTLRSLVAQINETFSRNFQEMAVAGEVSLDEHDMEFNKFGILIKVKFRQTGQLQVLSAHHQSGGERSVSTILYLVSLQDLTYCPFRVVDEINQGMDPINERKMFQQLVRAASQPNTPQCFLLTPKLLPDLDYGDACTILNIMNGPWIDQPSKVWSDGESWGKVMGLLGS